MKSTRDVTKSQSGDRVRLKPGGATISLVLWDEEEGACVCYWFEGIELKRQFFKPDDVDWISHL